MNLLPNTKWNYVGAAVAAASNTDDNSAIVDMAGWDGIVFVTSITDSADTGVASLIVEQNTIDSATGMAALSGATATATSAANDDLNSMLLIVDVAKPRERYLRVNRTSATANIAFGDVLAIQYQGRLMPVTQLAAEVAHSVMVISPAEA